MFSIFDGGATLDTLHGVRHGGCALMSLRPIVCCCSITAPVVSIPLKLAIDDEIRRVLSTASDVGSVIQGRGARGFSESSGYLTPLALANQVRFLVGRQFAPCWRGTAWRAAKSLKSVQRSEHSQQRGGGGCPAPFSAHFDGKFFGGLGGGGSSKFSSGLLCGLIFEPSPDRQKGPALAGPESGWAIVLLFHEKLAVGHERCLWKG